MNAIQHEATIEDFSIIQAVLEGDTEAFAELVKMHHPQVSRLCLSMLLSRAEADDAAQDVFVKAFASLPSYKKDLSFQAWLYRIASNHCLDLLRKKGRHKTDSLDGLLDANGGEPPKPAQRALAKEEHLLEKQERLEMAMTVLAKLSPDQRQILVLRELDGLSYDQIASTLRCSLDAVKSRLRRARLGLQEHARHFSRSSTFRH